MGDGDVSTWHDALVPASHAKLAAMTSVAAGFEAFVHAEQVALRRYALALTGQPASADDLLQETLLKLFGVWERLEDQRTAGAYARTIMSRVYISWWRRWGRREVPTGELPDAPTPAPGLDRVGDSDLVWRALATLGRRQRAVVVLRYFEDLDEKSIAEALGISVGTVKSQHSRALAHLRTTLEGQQR